MAADHYKRTLLLAQDLGDRAVEAQACYSLGNTYTLLKDYPNAIEYHLRYLVTYIYIVYLTDTIVCRTLVFN